MIRCYCSDKANSWDNALPLMELYYNNAASASTQLSPFKIVYGYEPRFGVAPHSTVEAAAHELSRF